MTVTTDSFSAPDLASVTLADGLVLLVWSDGQQFALHPASLCHAPGFPGGDRPAGAAGRFPASSAAVSPRRASLDADGSLRVEWEPGVVESVHAVDWLRKRFEQTRRLGKALPGLEIWDASSIRRLSAPCYASLQADEHARLQFFDQVLNWGVSLLREVPAQQGIVETVASWFGQVQANPYADDCARPTVASIRVDATTPVATRQSHFLGPHTDTCWRQTLAGVLLMHCLQAHPEGGRSLLVDGFAVAERLRDEAPEAFELLATVPIVFGALVSEQDEWRAQGRVISVAADGVIEGIRYNGNSIEQLQGPPQLVGPMYAALSHFERILYDRELWWQPLLEPGDMLVIDNHRVLHGRETFDPAAGERHLQCSSVERDDFHNRYRCLARQHDGVDWSRRLSAGVI